MDDRSRALTNITGNSTKRSKTQKGWPKSFRVLKL